MLSLGAAEEEQRKEYLEMNSTHSMLLSLLRWGSGFRGGINVKKYLCQHLQIFFVLQMY